MNRKEYKLNEEVIDKIIQTAYGDADKETRKFVTELISCSDDAAEIFYSYKKTADKVRSVKPAEAPHSLNNIVDSLINSRKKKYLPFGEFIPHFAAKPIAAAGLTAIVTIAILLSLLFKQEKTYSNDELLLANRQVIESLALVGQIFKQTEVALTEDILGKQIGGPIKESIKTIDDLFLTRRKK